MQVETKIDLLSSELKQKLDHWLAKFPENQRRSAIIPALHEIQTSNQGSLTNDLIEAAADYIGIERISAFEVATFYSMFEMDKVGKKKLCLCTNISCMLTGSDEIHAHFKEKLGIDFGETSADGKFTLKEVECLGACRNGPVMQVEDQYYENLTPEKVDTILEDLA